MSEEQIKQFLDRIKPQLKDALKQYIFQDEKDPKEQLTGLMEEYLSTINLNNHIDINVHATPEEIEQYKWNITLTALDEAGAQMLKQFRGE